MGNTDSCMQTYIMIIPQIPVQTGTTGREVNVSYNIASN